jgi:hypothetical protein
VLTDEGDGAMFRILELTFRAIQPSVVGISPWRLRPGRKGPRLPVESRVVR